MQWVYHANSQCVSTLAVQADNTCCNGGRTKDMLNVKLFWHLINKTLRKVAVIIIIYHHLLNYFYKTKFTALCNPQIARLIGAGCIIYNNITSVMKN